MGNDTSKLKHVVTYHPSSSPRDRIKAEDYYLIHGPEVGLVRKHGLCQRWYPNGQMSRQTVFEYGRPSERDTVWGQDGKIIYTGTFGEQADKKRKSRLIWYHPETGTIKCDYTSELLLPLYPHFRRDDLKNQERDGTYREWSSTGVVLVEREYKGGYLDGVVREWHPDGTPMKVATYSCGLPDGKWTEWHGNGTLKRELTYRRDPDGEKPSFMVGPVVENYDNGRPHLRATFDKYGRDKGTTTRYWPSGEVNLVAEYKKGKVVRVVTLRDDKGRDCILPEGELIVWKACAVKTIGVYVKIMVPKDAPRVTPKDTNETYKSRISHGVVLAIESEDGNQYDSAVSCVYTKERLTYVVGERVAVDEDDFDDDVAVECGAGINVHRYRDHCTKWFPKS